VRPAFSRENASSCEDVDQRLGTLLVAFDEVADATAQSSCSRAPSRFGADDPAPQLTPLLARETDGKRAVGRFEQMMAFIEDIAGWYRRVVQPTERRLRHHERVVGDNNARLPCLADVFLDKAAAEVRASRVHAFAAPIRQPSDPPSPNKLGEPARKITRDQVAGLARRNPARYQPQISYRPSRPARGCANGLLEIQ